MGVPAALMLSACASFGDRVEQVSTPVVISVKAVVDNLKCDMASFLIDNNKLAALDETALVGTVSFNLARSSIVSDKVEIGIPVAPEITLSGGLTGENLASAGQEMTMSFNVQVSDLNALRECQDDDKLVVDTNLGKATLDRPLLNLKGLREQLATIRPDEPKITFKKFAYKGDLVLKQSREKALGIEVYFLKAGVTDKNVGEYKISYQIDLKRVAKNGKPGDDVSNSSKTGGKTATDDAGDDVTIQISPP